MLPVARHPAIGLRWFKTEFEEAAVKANPGQVAVRVHGYRRAYRIANGGPVVVLIHGIGDNSSTWEPIMTRLASSTPSLRPTCSACRFSTSPVRTIR